MAWEVEYTDEFGSWWDTLDESEQDSIAYYVRLLQEYGVTLDHPYSSSIKGSRHPHLRELRVQHEGSPYRVLYAFDPRRTAILIVGGDKTGDDRWYEKNVPIADDLYDTPRRTQERRVKLMAGRKPFKELLDKMPAERRARIESRAQDTIREMRLAELRESLGLTQEELGTLLDVKQAAVARLEGRADIRLGTLHRIIAALGGELEIVARFPEGVVRLTQFERDAHHETTTDTSGRAAA